ncbi:MAG: hypothetical protein LBU42_05400 [Prevotellaceae bacterium]|nr:hypothetical protein [Prevotellaceae bacterium]
MREFHDCRLPSCASHCLLLLKTAYCPPAPANSPFSIFNSPLKMATANS